MKVHELRPGMVFAPTVPEMTSMIFLTQSRHPLWPGLQLVVWRDVETDKVVFDALHHEQDLDGTVHEADRETQMAWLRRGVLGREAAEDMMHAMMLARLGSGLSGVADAVRAVASQDRGPTPYRFTDKIEPSREVWDI